MQNFKSIPYLVPEIQSVVVKYGPVCKISTSHVIKMKLMSINLLYQVLLSYKVSTLYHFYKFELWTTIGFFCQLPIVYMWWRHNVMTYDKTFFIKSCLIKSCAHLQNFVAKLSVVQDLSKIFRFQRRVNPVLIKVELSKASYS